MIKSSAETTLGFERNTVMDPESPASFTKLLIDWGKGDRTALDEMLPLVYGELRRLAAHLSQQPDVDLIALDDALTQLSQLDQRKSRIVELKFFGGMTTEEIEEVLQISSATIEREWGLARAWLYRAVAGRQ